MTRRTGEGYAVLAAAAAAYVFLIAGIIIGAALQGNIGIVKSADYWIDRYQTLIAAMIALGVGLWAARPVYRQLVEVRRQSAIQTYEILHAISATLRDESRTATELALIGNYLLGYPNLFEEHRATMSRDSLFQTWQDELTKQVEALNRLNTEIAVLRSRSHAEPSASRARSAMSIKATETALSVVKTRRALLTDWERAKNDPSVQQQIGLDFGAAPKELSDACKAFQTELDREEQRIAPLLSRALIDARVQPEVEG
jgi:hypothetical protein